MAASRNRDDIGTRLLNLKERLEEEKAERAELQGEFRSLMNQLKEDFGVSDLDEAEVQIEEEEARLEEMEREVREQVEELEGLMRRYG